MLEFDFDYPFSVHITDKNGNILIADVEGIAKVKCTNNEPFSDDFVPHLEIWDIELYGFEPGVSNKTAQIRVPDDHLLRALLIPIIMEKDHHHMMDQANSILDEEIRNG